MSEPPKSTRSDAVPSALRQRIEHVHVIGEERDHNPRLQIPSKDEYVQLMRALKLPDPKLMDAAVPANLACGNAQPTGPASYAM